MSKNENLYFLTPAKNASYRPLKRLLVSPSPFLPSPHFRYQENRYLVKRRRLFSKLLYFPPFPSPSLEDHYRIYRRTLAVTNIVLQSRKEIEFGKWVARVVVML